MNAPFTKGVQVGDGNRQQNVFISLGSLTAETPSDLPDQEEAGTHRTTKLSLGGVAVVFLLVAVGCWNLINGSSEPKPSFPAENGQRPTGSSDLAIREATLASLTACAKVAVLKPLHCPQIVDDFYSDDAQDVTWRIHGDPGDGSKVVYNGDEGRFHMLGTAVMSVSYRDNSGQRLRVRVVHYWSRVEWTDNQAKVVEIRAYDDTPRPPTDKRNPSVADDVVFALVETAFRKCVSAKFSPMPPECPSSKAGRKADKAEWKLKGNPLVNARAAFDPATGLIHVRGNYSATMTHRVWLSGVTSETESGSYDAIVSVDNGKPNVLRIQRA